MKGEELCFTLFNISFTTFSRQDFVNKNDNKPQIISYIFNNIYLCLSNTFCIFAPLQHDNCQDAEWKSVLSFKKRAHFIVDSIIKGNKNRLKRIFLILTK